MSTETPTTQTETGVPQDLASSEVDDLKGRLLSGEDITQAGIYRLFWRMSDDEFRQLALDARASTRVCPSVIDLMVSLLYGPFEPRRN